MTMKLNNQRLEELLKLAISEPVHSAELLDLLLSASVLVPGTREESAVDGSAIELQHWQLPQGGEFIPFFSSESSLSDVAGNQFPSLVMPVRTLFEMTPGATLFLNPGQPAGKLFLPGEVAGLLGIPHSVSAEQRIVDGGDALLLSEVTEPPAPLINALKQLFAGQKLVRRAFLAQERDLPDAPPNWLIGIEADGNTDRVISVAGQLISGMLEEDQFVDFCEVTAGHEGVSHFFTAHITPFYQRRWGSFLRDIEPGTLKTAAIPGVKPGCSDDRQEQS